jgi:uncharacterized membrane protein
MTDTALHTDDASHAASKRRDAVHDQTVALAEGKGSQITAPTVTIRKPVGEVFRAFRDFARWPTFMENVERIDVVDATRSHWVVKAPGGRTVEWEARITAEETDRFIEWTSEEGADVPNSGRVTFRDAGERGTVVTATILYTPPLGIVGKIIAKMFQREPAVQGRRDLRRFKQLLETGEVATAARNPKMHEEMGL